MLRVIVILVCAGIGYLGGRWAGRYIPDETWRMRLTLLATAAIALVGGLTYPAAVPEVVPPEGSIVFIEHTIASDLADVRCVHAADLDGDGDMDVLGADGDAITWWENERASDFTAHSIAANFFGANFVHAGDLDGDADVDAIGVAGDAGQIAWWENDGGGGFVRHAITGGLYGANSVDVSDIDGDGDLDLVGAAWYWYENDVVWLENDGSGGFARQVVAEAFDGLISIRAVDLDGDGDVDILGARGMRAEPSEEDVLWWENDGGGGFTRHVIADDLEGARSADAADVDGDGDLDVLVAGAIISVPAKEGIVWWENDGAEDFSYRLVTDDFGAARVRAADLDGDGDVDVIGASHGRGQVTWWENDGSEDFASRTIADDFGGAISVSVADLDGDGDLDVLGAAAEAGKIAWWQSTR